MKKPEKQEFAGKKISKRDAKGRFIKGVSGNPKGRPIFSPMTILREELQKIAQEQREEYVRLWIRKYVQEGYSENDGVALRDIFDRIEGKPRQIVSIDNEKDAEWLEVFKEVAGRIK